jgi:outer membrane receptor protein involved in Fe transport
MSCHFIRAALRVAAGHSVFCFTVALPTVVVAQATAGVTGVVTDASSRQPVPDAQVFVRGTRLGVSTDDRGRFTLAGLPAGPAELSVQRLGYTPTSRRVVLSAGVTDTIEIALEPAAQVIAPMVVSATREARRREEASATIDVLDGAALREARAAHPAAIANRIPGVHVSQLSGEGHSTAIRQPITTKPLYLYLEDGVPTRSTGFFNHNALYEVNLPQAGGLEVLKGPGTALYGSDAIGGVVNALTRPAPAAPTIDFAVEGGAYGYRRFLATGGTTRGNQGIRFDLNLTSAEGWKDDAPYTRKSATVRHDLAARGLTFRTVVTGTLVDQRDVLALGAAAFEDRPELNRSPIAFRDVTALRWSTAIERDQGSSLVSITPYARHNVLGVLPNWQLTYDPEVWDSRNDSWGLLVRYRRDFAPWRMRVIAGADFEVSPGAVLSEGITSSRTGPDSIWATYTRAATHYDYDVTYRQASPYLHVEASPVRRVRVDAGLRYDNSGYSYDNALAPLATGRWRRPADTTVSFAHLSPKVGVTVDLPHGINAFASFRQGFRAPAQGQLFQQGSNANTTGLEPVTVRSMELGVRGAISGRLVYALSAYDMRIENDILSILDEAGIRTSSNAGETRHRGVEFSLGAALTPVLRADVAWSSARQTYEQWDIIVGSRNVSYAGRSIEAAPRTLGNALLTWTPSLLRGGRLAAEWSHTGPYFMDAENTRKYGGFDLWTLHGNVYLGQAAELFARVTNLTDRRYAELATYAPFTGAQYTPGNPRMLFAGMRWSWQGQGGTPQ